MRPLKVLSSLVLAAFVLLSLPRPAVAEGDVALTRQVIAAAKRDHFDEAARLARQSHSKVLPRLVTWMAYVSGRSGADFAQLSAFIHANPEWPMMSQMTKRAEESITAATPIPQVLAWFDSHPPTTADGGQAYARALFAAGRDEQAVQVIRDTWVNLSFGALQEKQYLNLLGEHLRYEDHWRRLDRLL